MTARTVTKVRSPQTGHEYATVPVSGQEEVGLAVQAARSAFRDWSGRSVQNRCELVRGMADWLKAQYGEAGSLTALKEKIMTAVGKPLLEADIEVIESASFIDYFCEIAPEVLEPQKVKLSTELWPTKESTVYFEPLGVVGVIKPWNYPLEMPIWALIPALLAGNTIVLKPSEKTPTIGLLFGEIATAVGLPPGVLNVVAGDQNTGRCLVEHREVDMIAFTGSVAAGRSIAEACGRQLKKVTLELGGNDAAIVLDDVDIELAANGLTWGAFCNAGQVCVGIKRALVSDKIAEKLLPLIVDKTKALRLGVDVGPLIDERQLRDVQSFVGDAVKKGAKVLTGGKRSDMGSGLYFEPTVLTNLNEEMRLMKEECFGPILPIHLINDLHEAVTIANNSDYGLGASIWTSDENRAARIARELRAGMVWVNDVNVAFAETPWGGTKNSGQGFELSADAIREYVFRKHVSTEKSGDKRRFWWYPYS